MNVGATQPLDTGAVLGLPASVLQPARIPKKMLVEQASSHASDAALIMRAVASASVEAVLRPHTLKVPAYVDDHRRVEDIAVLHIKLADAASPADTARLVELLHRSMPRPLILFLVTPTAGALLSLALTHVNNTDPDGGTSVIDRSIIVPLARLAPEALKLGNISHTDLWALYRDLVRVVAAGGSPSSPALSAEEALELRGELAALEAELAAAIRDAKGEKSQAGRIRLNTRAKVLRKRMEAVASSLHGEAETQ